MNNRFGLKDAVQLLVVLGVGLVVLLGMVQDDRRWGRLNDLATAVEAQDAQLGQLIRRLDARSNDIRELTTAVQGLRGAVEALPRQAAVIPASPGGAPPADAASAVPALGAADESWARPGVPITRPKTRGVTADPRRLPGYAEGGTLVEVFEAQPPKITPYTYADTYGRRVVEFVAEFLAEYSNDGTELHGVLADAWQMDPAGRWLRAHLRPNVRFSDGTPVTAEDVRYSFHDVMFNAEIESARFRSVYNVIRSVSVIAPNVVEFEFVAPKFNNEPLALRFPVIPKHFYSRFTPSQINAATGLLMGSGPYRLAQLDPDNQWTPGQDIVLVRNEQYWGTLPPIKEIRIRVQQDAIARLTAFENGESDMIRPSNEQYARKMADPAFRAKNQIFGWPNIRSGYAFIGWNCGQRAGRATPFADARVRRAMTLLLDRDRIKRDVFEDLGLVATGPFNPFASQSNPKIKPMPYDLGEARRLLAEAGWEDRDGDNVLENARGDEFVFEFTTATGSEVGRRMSPYVKDQCALVGIRCEVRVIDWSVFQSVLKSRDFDALTMSWSPNDPEVDPYQVWHSRSIENQGDNFAQWSNPKADQLIEAGRLELDAQKRLAIWHELHQLIHDEQPYTFLCNLPWVRFLSPRVKNFTTHPLGMDYTEWYIPAAAQ